MFLAEIFSTAGTITTGTFCVKNQPQPLMIFLVSENWGIFRRIFLYRICLKHKNNLSLPISNSCLDNILRFFLFQLFTMRESGREEIVCKWHLVALCRGWQVHVRKLVLSPVETSPWQGCSVLSCQLQHSNKGFATLDQATGPSGPSLWRQPARDASGRRYATQIPRSMVWSMESSPGCLPHHHCFLLRFLKNSLNATTAFAVCFLCSFLLGFCSVKH